MSSSIPSLSQKKLEAVGMSPTTLEEAMPLLGEQQQIIEDLRQQLVRAEHKNAFYEYEQAYQYGLFCNPDLGSSEKLVLITSRRVIRELRADDDTSLTEVHLNQIAEQTGLTSETVGKKLHRLDTVFHAVSYTTKKRNTGRDASGKSIFVTDTKVALLPLAEQPHTLCLPDGSPRQGGPREKKVCPVCGSEKIKRTVHTRCLNCHHVLAHTEVMLNEQHAEEDRVVVLGEDVVEQLMMNENEVEGTCEVWNDEETPLNTSDGEAQEDASFTQDVRESAAPMQTTHERFISASVPLVEPEMTGPIVDAETPVLYVEWHNGERYQEPFRTMQLQAAQWLHTYKPTLTLELLKRACDDCWEWAEGHAKPPFHLSHLTQKQEKTGVVRLDAVLKILEAKERQAQIKKSAKPATAHVAKEKPKEDENEQVLWSPLPEALIDPLEYFESFRYMSVAQAKTYGYETYKKLVPMDENNVLGKQRGLAAARAQERGAR